MNGGSYCWGALERFNNDNLVLFLFSNRVTQKSQTLRTSFFKTVTASATAVSHPLWPKREQNSSKTFDMIISKGTQVDIGDVDINSPKSS